MIKRILDISKKLKLSHIGSCVTMADLLDYVFMKKRPEDIVVLSAGHAGLALYVALEKYEGADAEELFKKHGVHPNKDKLIHATSGSLGHGIGIAVGYAIANPSVTVYCLTSDGEMMEGSVYEALRIANNLKLSNLYLLVNANGYGAYSKIPIDFIYQFIEMFPNINMDIRKTTPNRVGIRGLNGLSGHYYVLKENDY
jgi:transketolase